MIRDQKLVRNNKVGVIKEVDIEEMEEKWKRNGREICCEENLRLRIGFNRTAFLIPISEKFYIAALKIGEKVSAVT